MYLTKQKLPLCLVAICPARARSLPAEGWATALTNSSQEGSPKRVVSYFLFSHSMSIRFRQLDASELSALILLRRSGCSPSAIPTLLQLCATLSSSVHTSNRSWISAKKPKQLKVVTNSYFILTVSAHLKCVLVIEQTTWRLEAHEAVALQNRV